VAADLEELPDWERLLAAERHLQALVPGAVLRRAQPLETELVDGLRVPTLAEMARIKAWLLATRHTLRDYLDLVVLLERLGESAAVAALRDLDTIYAQPTGASVLVEVAERLAAAAPSDLAAVDLATYKGLCPPWNRWDHVAARGRAWAPIVARIAMAGVGAGAGPT
jgi:hypothetical protein